MIKRNRLFIYILGGFLFSLDQVLKYTARTNPEISYVWKKFIGWEYFANPGIAFSIPIPNSIIIFLTPLIILALSIILIRNKTTNIHLHAGIVFIILGAVSNFVDRVLFDITIDYLRIFTSVINLADLMIVVGVILSLKQPKNKAQQ